MRARVHQLVALGRHLSSFDRVPNGFQTFFWSAVTLKGKTHAHIDMCSRLFNIAFDKTFYNGKI